MKFIEVKLIDRNIDPYFLLKNLNQKIRINLFWITSLLEGGGGGGSLHVIPLDFFIWVV